MEPKVNPLVGVLRVLVTEISPTEVRGVAHSLQNFAVSGFSVWHFGQCVATSSPYLVGQILSRNGKECQTQSGEVCQFNFSFSRIASKKPSSILICKGDLHCDSSTGCETTKYRPSGEMSCMDQVS